MKTKKARWALWLLHLALGPLGCFKAPALVCQCHESNLSHLHPPGHSRLLTQPLLRGAVLSPHIPVLPKCICTHALPHKCVQIMHRWTHNTHLCSQMSHRHTSSSLCRKHPIRNFCMCRVSLLCAYTHRTHHTLHTRVRSNTPHTICTCTCSQQNTCELVLHTHIQTRDTHIYTSLTHICSIYCTHA